MIWFILFLIAIVFYQYIGDWVIILFALIVGFAYFKIFFWRDKTLFQFNRFFLDLAKKYEHQVCQLNSDDLQRLNDKIDQVFLEVLPETSKKFETPPIIQEPEAIYFKEPEIKKIETPPIIQTTVEPEIEIIPIETVPVKPKKHYLPSHDFFTKILMPFLWQNIGWFIGGFCFVSGSIFLVAYTTGFYNALTIFGILCFYSLILFLGGYQIRRRRPELVTSSTVLLTLGVLLIPLNMTAAVRLIQSGTVLQMGFAVFLSIIAIGIFFVATRFASGVIERGLQDEHPRLFIGLAALQFTQPLLPSHWFVLIALHLTLLGLLAYALHRFTQYWLQSIFIEQQKTAYYAAGTLFYAAVVSFVLLTWGSGISLPAGYAGAFLMLCCLLLLHVDIHFKQWVHKQALLSYFSFVIYALSLLAILLSLPNVSLTLALGAVLYGLMVWKYLTLVPLYLLLACLSGLYSLLILQYFPYHTYFLLSLPGLGGIMLLHRFAQKRDSAALALVCCRVMITLGVGLLVWSLFYASPGEIAMFTALTATLVILRNLYQPSNICQIGPKLKIEPFNKVYVVTALTTVTLAYSPLYFGEWLFQFSSGLIVLAMLWAIWGLFCLSKNIKQAEVLFNSSLLSLALSIMVTLSTEIFFAFLLIMVSGVLLYLSLSLRLRLLFYAMLLSLGIGGTLVKQYYFPVSTGRGVILLGLAIWLVLWWFQYRGIQAITTKIYSFRLLWFMKVKSATSLVKMVKTPLQQTMILFWIVGLWRIFETVWQGVDAKYAITIFLSAVLTGLLAKQWLVLLPLSIFLLWGALLLITPLIAIPLMSASYVLMLWGLTLRFSWGKTVHWTVFIISLLSVGGALLIGTIIPIIIVALFFLLAGLHYRSQLHSYFLIASLSLILLDSTQHVLGNVAIITPILALIAIGLAILAQSFVAYSTWKALYKYPLYVTAAVIYLWALFNSLFLVITNGHGGLSLLFIVLALGQLPLLRPLKKAADIRGIGIGLLLSIIIIASFWQHPLLLMFWGFILWGISNYGLPHLKEPWKITPIFWPILGLFFVLGAFALDLYMLEFLRWETLLLVTLYLFLMFRNVQWGWLSWLSVLSFASLGVNLLVNSFPVFFEELNFIFILILWANILLVLSVILKRYGDKFLVDWKFNRLAKPLFVIPFALLNLKLIGLILINLSLLLEITHFEPLWENFIFWAILLNLSFLHILLLPKPIAAHIFLLSLLNTVLLLLTGWLNLPLILTLWTIGLLLLIPVKILHAILIHTWIPFSFGIALFFLIAIDISIGERLLTLGLLSGVSFVFGLLNQQENIARAWQAGGIFLLWLLLHFLWFFFLPEASFISLLPWYALQNALLAWGVFWICDKTTVQTLLAITAPLLASLASIFCLGHLFGFFIEPRINLFGNLDHIAFFLTGILLIKLSWQIAEKELRIYTIAVIVGLLGLYSRLLWMGLAPLNVWDTAGLMCAGYVLFTFNHFMPSQSLFRLTFMMPILAILTVPLQLDSIYASTTLIAGATLYLLMQPRSQNNLPMYLGLLILNLGIYLWIPGWADNYKLLQLYTIPVAITVLLMLQLHQLELKPHVMNATRLAALSTLYASATLDVFMRPELSIFILAIALSLGGVILGIALRIRVFLYIGTLFLIFNVLGQLIDFYPEDRLSKAIVLMVLGGIITGGMIWFNIQREALMQRLRIIRADLAQWE